MRYQKTDDELRNKVVDMYRSGVKRNEISKELKLSRSLAYEVINAIKQNTRKKLKRNLHMLRREFQKSSVW